MMSDNTEAILNYFARVIESNIIMNLRLRM